MRLEHASLVGYEVSDRVVSTKWWGLWGEKVKMELYARAKAGEMLDGTIVCQDLAREYDRSYGVNQWLLGIINL